MDLDGHPGLAYSDPEPHPDPVPHPDPDPVPHPDPDPYPFQPNVKLNYSILFSRKFQYTVGDVLSQKISDYDTYDADEKDKTM